MSLYISTLFSQEISVHKALNDLTSLNKKIITYYKILKGCEKFGIKSQAKSPYGLFALNESQINRIYSELNILKEAKRSIKDHELKIEIINKFYSELYNEEFLSEYNRLFKKYEDYKIVKTFFTKNFFTPNVVYKNIDGILVTYIPDDDKFYHALSTFEYWYPTGRIGKVKDILEHTIENTSELCIDATNIYKDEWKRYNDTRIRKEVLETNVTQHIIENLLPKVEHLYKIKFDSASSAVLFIACEKKEAEKKFNNLVLYLRNKGVPIPKLHKIDLATIKKSVFSYNAVLDDLYSKHLALKNKGKCSEAAYYLFLLISIDFGQTYSLAHQNYLSFVGDNKKIILKQLNGNFLTEGKFSGYNKRPLSNYEFIVLTGLSNKNNLVKCKHSISERNQLPNVKLKPKEILNLIKLTGHDIPTISEFEQLTEFDSNSLQNTYKNQLEQVEIERMSTDNYDVIGLLSGGDILLYDQNSQPRFYKIKLEVETSWGMNKAKLIYQLNSTDILDKPAYLNIRLKQ